MCCRTAEGSPGHLPWHHGRLRLFRLDLLVDGLVIVELKSVERLEGIHEAQVLTYLKLTKLHLGLLMNFNVVRLMDGFKRLVREFPTN